MRTRAVRGALLGILVALTVWVAGGWFFFRSMERGAFELLFRARGIRYPAPQIVIVVADDSTISRYSYPLPRRVYADLIDHLAKVGAQVVAMDIMFVSPSAASHQSGTVDDAALIAASRRAGRVVHAAALNFEPNRDPLISNAQQGNATTILERFQIPDRGAASGDTVWGSAAMPSLQKTAAGLGHVNAPPEYNGVLYRIPHALRFRGGGEPVLYPSLALAAATVYYGASPKDIVVKSDSIVLPTPRNSETRERRIPVDSDGRTWVNWIGQHNSFTTYSITNILDGKIPAANLKDKIILVGTTAAGSFELRSTPFSTVQPAVELQANALDDILMNRSLHYAPFWWGFALLVLCPATVGAIALTRSGKFSIFATLGVCASLWFLALGVFSYGNILLQVAAPILVSLLTWGIATGYRQYQDAQQLRMAEERYAMAVRGANDGLWDWDVRTGEIYFAPRWKSMLGYADTEIGASLRDWFDLVHPDDLEQVKAQIDAHLADGVAHFESQHRMKHKDGRWVWVLSRGLRVDGDDGKPARMAGSQSDISLQVEANEQLERNAFYDSLTGLPNRALFLNLMSRALGRSRRSPDYRFAVLFMDLDRFKLVNDSLGHARGDEFLVAVARRLESCLRPGDTAARLGGDEFTVLLDDIGDAGAAARIVERIQSEIIKPFDVGGHEVFPTSSIGIALSGPAYHHPEELLRDADTAMYRAKALGRARHAVFDEAMHEHALGLLRLETDLRRALERQNFKVFYQPIVDLQSGHISGFEALVRWHHPERGMVPPGEFIALAEETGLIIPLDHIVLREACSQLEAWKIQFPEKSLTMSVNLSSKQFAQPDLVPQIGRIMNESGVDPKRLKLEITEGVLMNNPETAAAMLRELRAMNIRLSIDDFGTGYSSLSYLHRFPLDTLKVDQSFVNRMGTNGENSEIVRTIVTLARNLNMDVIAEGIETPSQMHQLRDLKCEYGQGYLFAKPLPAIDAEALLNHQPDWLAMR
ncbi:MAG TPA: EAL domain-containing protein [Abditibacteriaceae bacterium]|jgi:diguanylate cyclase (GGDEF)-like protein/PAS domain S-box-containing protein